MQRALLKEMDENGWAVTFSIGVLTLTAPQSSVDEMLRRADQLMYVAKNGGKNNIRYATYPEKTVAAKLDV
jgi:PleD family two-component response regulator